MVTSKLKQADLVWAILIGALACFVRFGVSELLRGFLVSTPWFYFIHQTSIWAPWPIVLIVGLKAFRRPHAALFLGLFLTGSLFLDHLMAYGGITTTLGRGILLGLAARFSWPVQDKNAKYLFYGVAPAIGLQLLGHLTTGMVLIGPAWPLLVYLALYSGLVASGNFIWAMGGQEREAAVPSKRGPRSGWLRFALMVLLSALIFYMFTDFYLFTVDVHRVLVPYVIFFILGWQDRRNPKKFLGVLLLCSWLGAVAGPASVDLQVSQPHLLVQVGIFAGLCAGCVMAWGLEWTKIGLAVLGLVPGLALMSMVYFAPGRGTMDSQGLGYAIIFGIPGYYLAILLPLWIIDRLGAVAKGRVYVAG